MMHMFSLGSRYKALVIGASGGVGSGFVERLSQDPACVGVVGISRRRDGFDITDEASVEDHARQLAGTEFGLIVCATGALEIDGVGPEKTVRHIQAEAMARQFSLNAIGPALVLKHFTPLLPKHDRSIFAFLSARVGSIGDNKLGGWISYRASKAALNQVVHTVAIEMARTKPNAVLVAMHPGTVATRLSSCYSPAHAVFPPAESAAHMLETLDVLTPQQSGGFFAYDGTAIEW